MLININIISVAHNLIIFLCLLLMCAYTVLAERKISSWIQRRMGPNRITTYLTRIPILGLLIKRMGLLQPLVDALKFLFKEDPVPRHVYTFYYCIAPFLGIIPAMTVSSIIPFGQHSSETARNTNVLVLSNVDTGLLIFISISSISVYGIIIGGWASNNKYSLMGGIRASAQIISYEIILGLSVLPIILLSSNFGMLSCLSLTMIVESQEEVWYILYQPISALIFLVSLFAETNRLPFDMAESETDLVGGFHTEYGAFKFGLFFLTEYAHIIIGSSLFTCLFLGGWHFLPTIPNPWQIGYWGSFGSIVCFFCKVFCVVFLFIWTRWTLPRFRYDQVMTLGWRNLLPLSILNIIIYILFITLI